MISWTCEPKVPQSIVGMEVADIAAALGPEHPRFRAVQIYQAVYRQRVTDLHRVSTLPKPLRDNFPVGVPEIDRQFDRPTARAATS